MERDFALHLLEKVKEDYRRLAREFSETRLFPWKDILFLKEWVKDGDRVLDLGCGNGRLLELFKDTNIKYVGLDISEELLNIARSRYTGPNLSFVLGDALDLPFDEDSFDTVYAIALLHHIPSTPFRFKVMKEVHRVLKGGGIFVSTVWNLWQKRYIKYILSAAWLKILGRTRLDFKDAFIPWKKKDGSVIQRYCHAFTRRELQKLAEQVGFSIKEVGFTLRDGKKSNIYLVALK
ncbi:MAG: class I SAM-dependent methyltransferase [Actinomycetota bacterium]